LGLKQWRHTRHLRHALATVTEVEARQDAQGNIFYFPHFRFRLSNEDIVQAVAARGVDDPSGFSDREKVRVAFLPGDPQGAVLAPLGHIYRWAIGFGIAGTALFDIGGVLWIRKRQRETGLELQQRLNNRN
jgi:hypothetical protein